MSKKIKIGSKVRINKNMINGGKIGRVIEKASDDEIYIIKIGKQEAYYFNDDFSVVR